MTSTDCCAAHAGATGEPVSFALLLGTGLLMSAGHCLGMCGPIVTAFALAQGGAGRPRAHLLGALAIYNAGRVSSYAALGALSGLAGAALLAAGGAGRTLAGALSLVLGAVVAAAGLALADVLPFSRWLEAAPLGDLAARAVRSLLGSRGVSGRFALGVANGLLPCGPVAAAALAAAAAGGTLAGAAAMIAFGLGTVPATLALGLGASALGPTTRARLRTAGAVTVILMGAQLALRGLHALGLVPALRIGPVVLW